MNFNEEYNQSGSTATVGMFSDFFNFFARWEVWIGFILALAVLIGIFYLVPVVQRQSGHGEQSIQTIFKNVQMRNFGSDEWVKNAH